MSDTLRKGISVLLAVMFVVSAALLAMRLYDDQKAAQSNQAAQELVSSAGQPASESPDASLPLDPTNTGAPAAPEPLDKEHQFLLELDLEALRQTSANVLGWIHIPDSVIDYPLMAFEDNDTGLNQAWDGSRNSAGSIFLECKNQRNFSDFNTIVYGHYMRNETMFGSLKHYGEQDYLDAHRLIYIVTEDYVRRYEVFSAYEADITSDAYRLYFEDDARRQSALDHYTASAQGETQLVPTVDDSILTLSTCMGNGTYETRWVVQAVLTGAFPR